MTQCSVVAGGNRYLQIANVVPRIANLDEVRERLREIAPKIRYADPHRQMAPIALEGNDGV